MQSSFNSIECYEKHMAVYLPMCNNFSILPLRNGKTCHIIGYS